MENEFKIDPFVGTSPDGRADNRIIKFLIVMALVFEDQAWFMAPHCDPLVEPSDKTASNYFKAMLDFKAEKKITTETKQLWLSMLSSNVRSVLTPTLDNVLECPCARMRLWNANQLFVKTYTDEIVDIASSIEAAVNSIRPVSAANDLERLIREVTDFYEQMKACDKYYMQQFGIKVSWSDMKLNTFFVSKLSAGIFDKTRDEITTQLQEKAADLQAQQARKQRFQRARGADALEAGFESGDDEHEVRQIMRRLESGLSDAGGGSGVVAGREQLELDAPALRVPDSEAEVVRKKRELCEELCDVFRRGKLRKLDRAEKWRQDYAALNGQVKSAEEVGLFAASIARKKMRVHQAGTSPGPAQVSVGIEYNSERGRSASRDQSRQREQAPLKHERSPSEDRYRRESNGGGGGLDGGWRGGGGNSAGSTTAGECHTFRETGTCRFGNMCRFWHVSPAQSRANREQIKFDGPERGGDGRSSSATRERSPGRQNRAGSLHPLRNTTTPLPAPQRSLSPYRQQGAGGRG